MNTDDLRGYSRALYASWLWHRPLQLLIDAGEGVALALGTNVFAPAVVAITHGHSDHVLGLPGLAGARRFGKGAVDKPWTVLHPADSRGVAAMRAAIEGLWPAVAFPITWVAVTAGTRHRLTRTREIEAIPVTHVPPEPAVGYRVLETRRRLKPEHADRAAADIERLARQHGRDALMDAVEHVVFAHSGDAMPIDAALIGEADLLVHDATFLDTADRRQPIHASTEEVLALAREARVRALVINHLSVRYDRRTAAASLRAQLAASGFTGACWLLDEHEFINLR